jgi:hypothetical protein
VRHFIQCTYQANGPKRDPVKYILLQTEVVDYLHADQPHRIAQDFKSLLKDQVEATNFCAPSLLDYIYGWIHKFIKISQFIYLGPNGIQMRKLLYTDERSMFNCNYEFEL